ncbi:hypothetical protein JOB18_008626 [Solea senegalensis]|uniref:Secreted protein n=1 Tax=Solea senegalensis TaxID=28829 RepID=A0AAV6SN02_SOLSE|nr:hypothetical protein JOB18_008626 [Solea senegalensis]
MKHTHLLFIRKVVGIFWQCCQAISRMFDCMDCRVETVSVYPADVQSAPALPATDSSVKDTKSRSVKCDSRLVVCAASRKTICHLSIAVLCAEHNTYSIQH